MFNQVDGPSAAARHELDDGEDSERRLALALAKELVSTIEASPEAASTGMYYKEWNAQFDYFHHTEGMSSFTLQGLSEPYDPKFIQRTRTYAAMYMGDDPVGATSSAHLRRL